MKKAGYLIFAFFFNISRIRAIQKRKVVLFNGQFKGLTGNLLEIKTELEERMDDVKIQYFEKRALFGAKGIRKLWGIFRFFVLMPYHMATAGQVFLNDNFLPLQYCNPDKKAQFVQLWHGAGAFKKFGLSTERSREVKGEVKRANDRITHLFVTSKNVIPLYEWAFAIPRRKIFATGVPVTDVYFDEERKAEGKARFYKKYPELEGKKLLLITPTIRRTEKENRAILRNIPIDKMYEELGNDWVILLRLHPKIRLEKIPETEYCRNMTGYPEVTDLYFVSDLLMTDYSSTVVEYVLLDKPMIFYAYDLLYYDRGFYFDYREGVPGVVAETEHGLLRALRQMEDTSGRREAFRRMQFDYPDGNATQRIIRVLGEMK